VAFADELELVWGEAGRGNVDEVLAIPLLALMELVREDEAVWVSVVEALKQCLQHPTSLHLAATQ